jgi:hypothetical protein
MLQIKNIKKSPWLDHVSMAKVSKYPPTHCEGWMVTEQKNIFALGSYPLANHGNKQKKLSTFPIELCKGCKKCL